MRAIALAALLCASVHADPVVRSGSDSVRLTEKACPSDVLALIHPERRDRYMLAVATVGGVVNNACWTLIAGRGQVHLMYADADQGWIPAGSFKDEPGV